MSTTGSIAKKLVMLYRQKRKRPRHAVILWMRRNPTWMKEVIALEWERQTGEEWTIIFKQALLA